MTRRRGGRLLQGVLTALVAVAGALAWWAVAIIWAP